jgi:hypothetical protein
LKSRFTHFFEFPDWEPDDCVAFFELCATKEHFTWADGIAGKIVDGCAWLMEGWANGRDVKQLWEACLQYRSDRVYDTPEVQRRIVLDDFEPAMASLVHARRHSSRKLRVKEIELVSENAQTENVNMANDETTHSITKAPRPKGTKQRIEDVSSLESSLTTQKSSHPHRKSHCSFDKSTTSQECGSIDTHIDLSMKSVNESSIMAREGTDAVNENASAENQLEEEPMHRLDESTNVSIETAIVQEPIDIGKKIAVVTVVEDDESNKDIAGPQTQKHISMNDEMGDIKDNGRDDGVPDEVWAELELAKEARNEVISKGRIYRQWFHQLIVRGNMRSRHSTRHVFFKKEVSVFVKAVKGLIEVCQGTRWPTKGHKDEEGSWISWML